MDFMNGLSMVSAANHTQKMNDIESQRHNNQMNGLNNQMQNTQNQYAVAYERSRTEIEKERANQMAMSVGFYRDLLTKPMSEIAKYDQNFAKAYHIQQQTLTDWMLSQKAFKDLTYDLGLSLGFEEEKIDTVYLERVDEIVKGTNPNETIPEKLSPYKENAQYHIQLGLKKKYGGRLPNDPSIKAVPKPKGA